MLHSQSFSAMADAIARDKQKFLRTKRQKSAQSWAEARQVRGTLDEQLRTAQTRLYLSGDGEMGRWSRATCERRRPLSPQHWGALTERHRGRKLRLGPREDRLVRSESAPTIPKSSSGRGTTGGEVLDWAAIEVRAAARRVLERRARLRPKRAAMVVLPNLSRAVPRLAEETAQRTLQPAGLKLQEVQAAELLVKVIAAVPVLAPARLSVRELSTVKHLGLSARLQSQILLDIDGSHSSSRRWGRVSS
mmetsp:Transcript_19872/g.35988  ORF Transcript_19872/g.35988 Transcript_19872/m.35988 type:complete len:248 (-) Transcript_19872:10-753(-)